MIDYSDFQKCDQSMLQHTLNIYGLDMVSSTALFNHRDVSKIAD